MASRSTEFKPCCGIFCGRSRCPCRRFYSSFQVGLLAAMMNDRFQRLGDLAAGTMVVVEEGHWLRGLDATQRSRSRPACRADSRQFPRQALACPGAFGVRRAARLVRLGPADGNRPAFGRTAPRKVRPAARARISICCSAPSITARSSPSGRRRAGRAVRRSRGESPFAC